MGGGEVSHSAEGRVWGVLAPSLRLVGVSIGTPPFEKKGMG